jgi:N-acetylneuraminic acid mutarotase
MKKMLITILVFVIISFLFLHCSSRNGENAMNEKIEDMFKPKGRAAHGMIYAENKKIIVFGGVNYTSKYNYLSDTIEYDVEKGVWKKIEIIGEKPFERMGHEMVYIGNDRIILFGGAFGDYRKPQNYGDMWEFDTKNNIWKEIEIKGEKPASRSRHRMVYADNNKIIMFGGYNENGDCFDDTWEYNTVNKQWIEINTGDVKPPKRDTHAMAYVGNDKIILFGGSGYNANGKKAILNDTWEYDIENKQWTKLDIKYSVPSTRMYLWMTCMGNNKIILFGGWDDVSAYNDTWEYDVEKQLWSEIEIESKNPSDRDTQRMVNIGNGKLFMYGGWGNTTLKDIWEYDIINYIWTKR